MARLKEGRATSICFAGISNFDVKPYGARGLRPTVPARTFFRNYLNGGPAAGRSTARLGARLATRRPDRDAAAKRRPTCASATLIPAVPLASGARL